MENSNNRAFTITLTELVIVLIALVILGSMLYVLYKRCCVRYRDAVRVSHINTIIFELQLHEIRGNTLSNVQIFQKTNDVVISSENHLSNQGYIDYDVIEKAKGFLDPLTDEHYPFAYSKGITKSKVNFKFYELATICELNKETKIIGNYYKLKENDSDSLITNELGIFIKDGSKELPYSIGLASR